MKTDLSSLKKEFVRLTDVQELKKELNRLSAEIRKFDLSTAIPSSQRARVDKRYRELKKRLSELQSRIDLSFAKVTSFVRQAAGRSTSKAKSTSKKKTSRKVASKGPAPKKVSKKIAKKIASRSK
jgi:predicted nuclease with TOPRIM domain